MSLRARLVIALAAAPVVLVALLFAAWAVDSPPEDQVVRNVELADRAVGGLDRSELAVAVDAVAERYAGATVRVETPDGDLEVAGERLGLALDEDATTDAVLNVGRDDPLLLRPFAWLASFVSPRQAPVVVAVDELGVREVLAEEDPTDRKAPVEPAVTGAQGRIEVVPGENGRGLVPAEVATAIRAAARSGERPIVVQAEPGTIEPRFSVDDAEALAEEARALTAEPLAVSAGGSRGELPVEMLRSWVVSFPTPDALVLDFDRGKALEGLTEVLAGAGKRPVDAGFRVEGGTVVAVPGSNGTGCCEERAGEMVVEALRSGAPGPVDLPLRTIEPERTLAEAQALGVREPVGSFTTNFQPGQSRVNNIHRMADLTRGVVIEPGETFSVNGHVGPRTRAKGFTLGGFINQGVLEEAIGGGVSQYATTLFNAAFFAGLDFVEYQSHSLYISRYPYGREATLSYPKPDLIIENTTPHGVLVWPTYTGSSITVTLYSTRYVTGEQTGQRESSAGNCTRVTTERTRRYVDGRTEVDTVFATYRPREGVDC
ncbi:MAG: VanW family protein [Actinomycetota bacterium]|nr:VanW family protein [Actinomycetota bacterium]